MASIVGGITVSHGPMLSTTPEIWDLRAQADQKSRQHWYRGNAYEYEKLEALRAPGFKNQIVRAEQYRRYELCQKSLDQLALQFKAWNADYAIIVGNDQNEVFKEDLIAPIILYTGESIENIPMDEARRSRLPPGISESESGHCPHDGAVYKGFPAVANQLVDALLASDFDIATSARLPKGSDRQEGIPHAFGFIYRRIMSDAPPPTIPLILNVGVGGNAIRTHRALALGRALAKTLQGLPHDAKVVLVGSGGMSHFVVDEELDQKVLASLSPFDESSIKSIPETFLKGNTAELKSWFVVAAAMHEAGLNVASMHYTACYRTKAGTGSGMGFVTWNRPDSV